MNEEIKKNKRKQILEQKAQSGDMTFGEWLEYTEDMFADNPELQKKMRKEPIEAPENEYTVEFVSPKKKTKEKSLSPDEISKKLRDAGIKEMDYKEGTFIQI